MALYSVVEFTSPAEHAMQSLPANSTKAFIHMDKMTANPFDICQSYIIQDMEYSSVRLGSSDLK